MLEFTLIELEPFKGGNKFETVNFFRMRKRFVIGLMNDLYMFDILTFNTDLRLLQFSPKI